MDDKATVTRGDLKLLQVDLSQLRRDMAVEFAKARGEMAEREERLMTSTQQQSDRLLSRLDFYTARMDNFRTDTILHGHVLVEVEGKLKDHELRLSKIEATRKGS